MLNLPFKFFELKANLHKRLACWGILSTEHLTQINDLKEEAAKREVDRLTKQIISRLPHMTNTNNPIDFPKVIK